MEAREKISFWHDALSPLMQIFTKITTTSGTNAMFEFLVWIWSLDLPFFHIDGWPPIASSHSDVSLVCLDLDRVVEAAHGWFLMLVSHAGEAA
jgi:hypothetical protein